MPEALLINNNVNDFNGLPLHAQVALGVVPAAVSLFGNAGVGVGISVLVVGDSTVGVLTQAAGSQ